MKSTIKRHLINVSNGNNYLVLNHNINDNELRQFSKRNICNKKQKHFLTLIRTANTWNENHENVKNNTHNNSTTSVDLSNITKTYENNSFNNSPYIPKNFEHSFCTLYNNSESCNNVSVLTECKTIKILEDINKQKEIGNKIIDKSNIRINEINMQMLPKSLHKQIFKNSYKEKKISEQEINSIKNNLLLYGIKTENASKLPEVDLKIPPLEGDDIEQHFYNIGKAQIEPYIKLIKDIMKDIPPMPNQWVLKEGWTRYTSDGIQSVDYPLESAVIFDVEVCMKEGPLPTLATAVSDQAWYSWVSKSLIDGLNTNFEGKQFTMDELIPMESSATEYGEKLNSFHKKPKIIVGHNVSYDRSKIKEQYWLKQTGLRFIDTMSLHICVGGINSYQRTILNSKKDTKEKYNLQMQTSLNSLAEVHKFYCNSVIDKDFRNIFVNGTLEDIRKEFNTLMSYCANDVIATHSVLCRLFPIFEERFPHPVTLAGMLELSTAYLPVNTNWQRYLSESESTFEDLNYETKVALTRRANTVCELMHNEKYKEDLWMWSEDWSTQTLNLKTSFSKKNITEKCEVQMIEEKKETESKSCLTDDETEEDPLEKEFAYLLETRKFLPLKLPHMPGYPAWYRKLCPKRNDKNWAPGPQNISISMQIVPKLLNLTWDCYPLHYIKENGWGILIPYTNNLNIETKVPLKQLLSMCPLPEIVYSSDEAHYTMSILDKDVQNDLHKTEFWYNKKPKPNNRLVNIYKGSAHWCNVDIDNCCYFLKLPHKNGKSYNVGNPMAKDFLNKFSEHVLVGSDSSTAEILKIAKTISYWRNNRDRIMSQLVIWFDKSHLPSSIKNMKKAAFYGAILPLVVVCGTLTRRAVEPTWMTASNADPERVGSELRAIIQAPPGYNIVGADVDSQELWISSIIGDAYYKKIHGATPFGWMTLIGNKSNETDMHSVTAKAIGISRSQAKVINYARIYGAGQKFAVQLLKQFNPSMTDTEAMSKSRKMFTMTKGKKLYKLKPEYITSELDDKLYSSYEALKISKMYSKSVSEMFEGSKWVGGSESAMFNSLEEIANSSSPVTPFLNARLTRALEEQTNNEKYLPTKINWVVQSGAVDFLHLMLVSMKWLMRDNVRFCLSFHDEVRYLVQSRHKYNAALAMHITNLLTRSFCASRLGMTDLPMSVAFFASVEVDTALRKESENDCVTPSNPHGLKNGYGVPPGETLDVWSAIEKSKGSVGPWHAEKKEFKNTTFKKVRSNVNEQK